MTFILDTLKLDSSLVYGQQMIKQFGFAQTVVLKDSSLYLSFKFAVHF